MNNFYARTNGSGNAFDFAAPCYAPGDGFAPTQQGPAQNYAGFQQGPHNDPAVYRSGTPPWAMNQQVAGHHSVVQQQGPIFPYAVNQQGTHQPFMMQQQGLICPYPGNKQGLVRPQAGFQLGPVHSNVGLQQDPVWVPAGVQQVPRHYLAGAGAHRVPGTWAPTGHTGVPFAQTRSSSLEAHWRNGDGLASGSQSVPDQEQTLGFQHALGDEPAASSQQPQNKQQPHEDGLLRFLGEDGQLPDLGDTLSAQLDAEFGGPYLPEVQRLEGFTPVVPDRMVVDLTAPTPVPAPAPKKGRKRRTGNAEGVRKKTSKTAPTQPGAATGGKPKGRPLGSKDKEKRKPRGFWQMSPAERTAYEEAREEEKRRGEAAKGEENSQTASAQLQTEPAPIQPAPAPTQTPPVASSSSDDVLIPTEELFGTLGTTNNANTMAEPEDYSEPETNGFRAPSLDRQWGSSHTIDPKAIGPEPIHEVNGWA